MRQLLLILLILAGLCLTGCSEYTMSVELKSASLDLPSRQLTVRYSRYDAGIAENNAVADIWIRSGAWRLSGGAWQAVHFTDTEKTGYDGVATFTIADLAGWSDTALPASGVEYKFTIEAWATDLVGDGDAKAIDSETFYFSY